MVSERRSWVTVVSLDRKSCIPSVAFTEGRISPVSSIGFLWRFSVCQSVASSPDFNECCRQEAEGFRSLYKGSRQDESEARKYETKHKPFP